MFWYIVLLHIANAILGCGATWYTVLPQQRKNKILKFFGRSVIEDSSVMSSNHSQQNRDGLSASVLMSSGSVYDTSNATVAVAPTS